MFFVIFTFRLLQFFRMTFLLSDISCLSLTLRLALLKNVLVSHPAMELLGKSLNIILDIYAIHRGIYMLTLQSELLP